MADAIGIAMLGAGNVGGGVVAALRNSRERYARLVGRELEVRAVLVRDASRERPGLDSSVLTTDIERLMIDKVQIVVEVMGGEEPAHEYMRHALEAGKHVVTANKEVMAKHGAELLGVAAAHGVRLFYEASVGGGIPVISPLSRDLLANEITAVTAIINGTTNFMLTAMANDGVDYDEVLAEAQRLGYAEPDPTADVEGIDAAYKLAILCGLAFGLEVGPEAIDREGISGLTANDFAYADELGYTIKLLATGRLENGDLIASVRPTLIAHSEPLAKVDGVLNAVQIEGDLVGRVLFEGPGAGAAPTASAVLADVLELARDYVFTDREPAPLAALSAARVLPAEAHRSRYYIRLTVPDRPGVLAQIAGALGERDVSIASMIQFETDESTGTAELVLTTHVAEVGALRAALDQVAEAGVVQWVGNVLPIAGASSGAGG
ncbi:MAG: homoserine dehydrogenase [Dehalococcoidia bacterium]|nr:homoserine dehydrogenase [Dehalococcoidia bacterium]